MSKRFTWGPDLGEIVLAALAADAAAPAAPAKLDVELVFKGVDAASGRISLTMLGYDPNTHTQPDVVHAVLFPIGDAIHNDPEQALAAGYPTTSAAVPQNSGGAEIVLERPAAAVAGTRYTGKTVLQFGTE